MTASRTLTVLVVDMVSSTELFSSLGVAAADEARRAVFASFTEAVAGHNGTLVKTTGDGCLASFEGAADATGAAVDMQQASTRLARSKVPGLALRAGIASGDVTIEDDDVFGPAVVVASRLCAAAGTGQILATEVVRLLAGDRGDHHFERQGELVLKGIAEPVAAASVSWEAADDENRIALPGALAARPAEVVVGRAIEWAHLYDAWKEVMAGDRRMVLVAGEPGVGKTRLVAELARRAHGEGATVLFGRCDEDFEVPYQPFVEALRPVVAAADDSLLVAHVAEHGGELLRLLPELARRLPGTPSPEPSEPEIERLRSYAAVVDLLSRTSQEAPTVLVLDDVHWAASATLQLLRHLLRAEGPLRCLVLCTYRDTEVARTHPLGALLDDVHREVGVSRLALKGLDAAGIEALLEAVSGDELDAEGRRLAQALFERTSGNPFFTGQVLRHLVERGALVQEKGRWRADSAIDELGLPEGVVDVVGRRLSALSTEANRVLAIAAVVGQSFSLRVLARIGDASPDTDTLVAALDEALASRLLLETDPGSYAFVHAIVREALLRELTGTRRALLHAKVGEAILAEHGDGPGPHLPALALHFSEAALLGDVERAVRLALAAAEQSARQADPEGAIQILERVVPLLEAPVVADAARYDVYAALSLLHSTQYDHKYLEPARLALTVARRLGDSRRMVRAVIATQGPAVGQGDPELRALTEEAVAGLADGDADLRALLLIDLGTQLLISADPEGQRFLVDGIEILRSLDLDDPAVAPVARRAATFASSAVIGSPDLELRQWLAGLAGSGPPPPPDASVFDLLQARPTQVAGPTGLIALATGDIGRYRVAGEELRAMVERTGSLQLKANYQQGEAMLAMLAGDFTQAREHAAAVTETLPGEPSYALGYFGQTMWIAMEEGTLADLLPTLGSLSEANPGVPALAAAHAKALVEAGDRGAAAGYLTGAIERWGEFARNWLWPAVPVYLSEVAVALGDERSATVLLDELDPFAGQLMIVGFAVNVVGAYDRFRGMLLGLLGRHDEAIAALEAAIHLEEKVEGPPLVARSRYWLGRALLARDGPGDTARAGDELRRSLGEAERMGMKGLAAAAALADAVTR